MKLGIVLLVIGCVDILLTVVLGAWFVPRLMIDMALIIYGIIRIRRHDITGKQS